MKIEFSFSNRLSSRIMDLKFGWLIILLMVLPYKLVKTDESPPNELHPSNLLSLDFISPDSYEVNISSYLDKQPPYYNGEVVIKVQSIDSPTESKIEKN